MRGSLKVILLKTALNSWLIASTLFTISSLQKVQAQCTFTPSWGGATLSQANITPINIANGMWAGEFSPVNILDPGVYTFNSTIATDFLTFTTATNAVLDFGNTPLTVTVTTPGVYRVHLAANASCLTNTTGRSLLGVYTGPPTPPSNNDAGVSQITSPLSFCPGSNNVTLRVENFGLNSIDSVQLNWQLNAGPIISQWISGPIASTTGTGPNFLDVPIGAITITTAGASLVAWTSLPNGVPDTINGNDTLNTTITTALNGTYTIDATQPTAGINFNSFTAFANVINSIGVCGPVIVNVAPGGAPYVEGIIFEEFLGASSINTVTINGNNNILRFAGTSTLQQATLTLDGTDHLTVNNLIIEAVGTFVGWGVHFYNQADSNTFNGCTVSTSQTQNFQNFAGIVFSNATNNINTAGNTGNYNLIENCSIVGGLFGISMNGESVSQPCVGNTVRNCVIRDFFQVGVLLRWQSNSNIEFNEINRATRTNGNAFTGVSLTVCGQGIKINGNRIHTHRSPTLTALGNFVGINIANSSGTSANPGLVTNNLIYNANTPSSTIGITVNGTSSSHWSIIHNTVILDQKPTSQAGSFDRTIFVGVNGGAVSIINNLLFMDVSTIAGNRHLIHYNSTSPGSIIENNAFYTNPTNPANIGFWNGTNYPTLAAWQGGPGFDLNGVFADPLFNGTVGASDFYRPTSGLLLGAGQNLLSFVPEDIESAFRTNTPDPGAFNINQLTASLDAGVQSLEFPTELCDETTNLVFRIRNYGSTIIDSVQFSYEINNIITTQWVSGPIDTAGGVGSPFIDITVGPVGGFLPLVPRDIKAWTSLPNNQTDTVNFNDTLHTTLTRGMAGVFSINPAQATAGTNFANFTDFANEVNANGICGPVIVNVAPGSPTFNERILLNEISGMSAINTITINGNGNTLSNNAANMGESATLSLFGTDHLFVDSLIIQATSSINGWALHLFDQADSNTFIRCSFLVDNQSNGGNLAGVVLNNGSTNNPFAFGVPSNFNTFDQCTFDGGLRNISINGFDLTTPGIGNIVRNSTLLNANVESIRIRSQKDLVIEYNEISRPLRQAFNFNGIVLNNHMSNVILRGNRIHTILNPSLNITTNITSNGIFLTSLNGIPTEPVIISNNLLYNFNNRGITRGIILSGMQTSTKILHNTIILDKPKSIASTLSQGISIISTSAAFSGSLSIENNLFYSDIHPNNTGIFLNNVNILTGPSINNNAYFLVNNQGNIGVIGNTVYPFFALWQTTGYDSDGVYRNPLFLGIPGTSDFYRPTDTIISTAGKNLLSDVPLDIELDNRTTTPTPGAFEFVIPCDTAPDIPTPLLADFSACLGSDAIIRLIPDSNANTYEWILPSGWVGSSTADTIAVSGISTTDTVFVFATNPCGSSDTLSIPVGVLNPQLIQSDTTICFGDSLILELAFPQDSLTTINWSHGPSATSVSVAPSVTTTYSLNLSRGGVICSDSVVVTVIPADTTISVVQACDSFFWSANNQTYTISGIYTETLLNSLGCDSIVSLDLTINTSDSVSISLTECDSYLWPANNQTYTISGIYTAQLTNAGGCDSIVNLNLTILPSDSIVQQITACDSYLWPVNSQTYTSTGVYSETFTKNNGCDSVVILNLTINPSYLITQNIAACDSFVWSTNNQVLTSSGTYTDTLTSSLGCDSIIELNLTISTANSGSENVTACDAFTWPANNQTYTSSGNYTAILTNAGGCDSTVTLNLTIDNSDSIFVSQTACDSYLWPVNSQTYTTSGVYSASFTKSNGCDSIIILNLSINPAFSSTQIQTTCSSYIWPVNNQTYTLSGLYSDTLTTINGCDSIIILDLTINSTSSGTDNITACGSYFWFANGQNYFNSGVYIDTLTNSSGCDSIVTLNLSINPVDTVISTVNACDSYQWTVTNFIYTGSGIYTQVLTSSTGCDSVLILDLTISESDSIVQSVTACNQYTWSETGLTYNTSGVYSVSYTSSAGCDSSYHLILTINEVYNVQIEATACDEYFWPLTGNTYNRSGMYTANFTTSSGCDSNVVLNLIIFESVVVNERVEASLQYTWPANNQTYSRSGMYQSVLQTINGCDSIINLDLSIRDGVSLFVPSAFTPNGNRLNEEFVIYGNDIAKFHIMIFNRFGQMIFESESLLRSWDGTYLGEPVPLGVYVYTINYTDEFGQNYTKRGTVTVLR
jgi:gliding motility-associated-like protein